MISLASTGGTLVLAMATIVTMLAATSIVRAEPAAPIQVWDGLNSLVGMAFDARGSLYVAEWGG